MAKIHSHIEVCEDCLQAIVNDSYPDDMDGKRTKEVAGGIDALPGWPVAGEGTEEFSRRTCQCCGTCLWGPRYAVTIFVDETREAPGRATSRNAFRDEEN